MDKTNSDTKNASTSSAEKPLSNLYLEQSKDNDSNDGNDGNDGNDDNDSNDGNSNKLSFDDDDEDTVC